MQENPVPIDLDGISDFVSTKTGEVFNDVATNTNVGAEPVEAGTAVLKPESIREVTVICRLRRFEVCWSDGVCD